MSDQRIFTCVLHNFTTVARDDGEVSCRGSAGTRFPTCATCDQAVADAFAFSMPAVVGPGQTTGEPQ